MFRDYNYIIKLMAIFILAGFISFHDVNALGSAKRYNILIINSYQSGYTWTDEETKGILSTLTKSNLPIDTHIEYLSWKDFPSNLNLDLLYKLFKYRYSNKKIDLIIASDDKALEFSLKYRNQILSSAPIVFCGVSKQSAKKLTAGHTKVTGVLEQLDPTSTIQVALTINPSLKNIYLVYDNTESGLSIAAQAISDIHSISPKLNVISLNNNTHNEIIKMSAAMNKNSAILMTSYYIDNSGVMMSFEEFCSQLRESSSAPIYHLYDYSMGHGVLGGSMISGYSHGSDAAKIALRVLNGDNINKIPIENLNSQKFYFDYNQLNKFHINMKLLPNNSTIINKPFSFFDTYHTLVIVTLSIMGLLLIFLLVLYYYLNRIRKMKHALETDNQELNALYEEMAATDETLRDQYQNLEKSQDELALSEERYRLVIEAANDGIWDYDAANNKTFYSDKWYSMLGYTKSYFDENIKDWESLIHPEDRQKTIELNTYHTNNETDFLESEFRLKTFDGTYKWIRSRGKALYNTDGIYYRMIGSHTDISKLKEIQEMLSYSAHHDTLTGLYNRMSMNEMVGKRLDSMIDTSIIDAMLFIDIDNFKYINDSMGHSYGDKLLIKVGARLLSFTNENLLLFRLGGDEFILYALNQTGKDSVQKLAREVLKSINTPFNIDGNIVNITISVGIAIYPEDATNIHELLRFADMAMYMAKKNNKNIFYFFNNLMNTEVTDRVNIENQLKNSLANNEFLLYYQPLVKPSSNKIEGFEALIRWNNKELGTVSPDKFIHIAEETGFINQLGDWVLKSACSFIKNFNERKNSSYIINVNISVIQLLQENFTDKLLDMVHTIGLDPTFLEIEITESSIMESEEVVINKLRLLRNHGIGVAIDDFGTGYSSLARLKTLPITTLKIDKSFIDNIAAENSYNEITDTIIELGHKLNLKIIAEGVETTSQLTYLSKNKCDTIQGYLFFKPMPEDELYKII